jgi:tetratricopeptide (TPR) repeat protein
MPDSGLFARNAGLLMAHNAQLSESLPYLQKASDKLNDDSITFVLADTYAKTGHRDEALKTYARLKTGDSANPTYWFNLAVLRSQGGDSDGAEKAYRKVLELNPLDMDTLNNLGLLLYKRGDYQGSMAMFDKLSQLNPNSTSAKVNYAAAATKAGDLKQAISAWKDLVRSDPAKPSLQLDLANALWDSGDYDGARFHYLEVLKVDKSSAEALNGVGLYHLHSAHYPQAEAAFRSSIDANSGFVPAYNNLAITLERMNRKTQALAVLEQASKIDGNDPDVKRNLQRMKASG